MPTCSFCKKNYEWPRGLTLVLVDGKILYFCSSKCRKNWKLKRDGRKINWVKKEKKGSERKIKKVEEEDKEEKKK